MWKYRVGKNLVRKGPRGKDRGGKDRGGKDLGKGEDLWEKPADGWERPRTSVLPTVHHLLCQKRQNPLSTITTILLPSSDFP